jgi:WD40 repeat protein
VSEPPLDPIHNLIDDFEREWRANRRPDIAAYLGRIADAERHALLCELLRLELEYRLKAGEPARVEECLDRFPEAEPETLGLIEHEYKVRLDCGERVGVTEYLARFPALGDPLLAVLRPLLRGPAEVPGYEILDELGRGGMGVVYRARHVRLNRVVALKMILSGAHAGAAELARFQTEAEAIARLHHSNVVQIHEAGECDGFPFVALELCPGGSLDTLLAAGPLPPRRAAELVGAAARGVHAAHEAKVVHRDLKPANVLLGADGTPRVSDFGLAKRLDGPGRTGSGMVLGTPSYMAPEQAQGKKDVGPAADVYALGAILFECLTSQPPFQAATPLDTLMRVVSAEPPRPTQLNPRVPRDLETICLKCLNKEPPKRYASAYSLAEDLRRWQAHEPIKARPVGPLERAVRWCRRKPVVAGLLAAVALLLVALTAGALGHAAQQRRFAEEKELARRETASGLYRSLLGQAAAVREAKELGYRKRVWEYLHEAAALEVPEKNLDQIRDEVLASLGDPIGVEPMAVANAPRATPPNLSDRLRGALADLQKTTPLRTYAPSPDGKHLAAFATSPPRVLIVDWEGKTVGQTDLPLGTVHALAFTPDGKILAAGCEEGTVVWDVPRLSMRTLFRGDSVHSVAIHPEGHLLLTTSQSRRAELWSLHSHRLVSTIKPSADVLRFDFSADGRFLLGLSRSGESRFGWLVNGTPEKVYLGGHRSGVTAVAFRADGRRLASVSKDRTVKIWDTDSGALLHACEGHGSEIQTTAFSPDGRYLASADWGGEVRLWDPDTGRSLGQIDALKQTRGIWKVRFDPRGRYVAAAGNTGLAAWTIRAAGQGLAVEELLAVPLPELLELAIHPDGSSLVALDRSGSLWACQTDNATPPRRLGVTGWHLIQGLRFDASGQRLWFKAPDGVVAAWQWPAGPVVPSGLRTTANEGFAVSADDEWAATQNQSHQMILVRLQSGQEVVRLPAEGGKVWAWDWSPDGTRVAVGLADGRLAVWDLEQVRARLAEFAIAVPSTARQRAGAPPTKVSEPVEIPPAAAGEPDPPRPAIVELAPVPNRVTATPEQVREWVAQLDTPRAQEAAQRLAAVGPAVLPDLEKAEGDAPVLVRQTIQTVRNRIERDEAIQPRRVSLRLDRVSLRVAAAALARESGLPLTLVGDVDTTVSLRLEGVPAWQAFDELTRQARVSAAFTSGRVVLRPGEGTAPELIAYPGPFRLQVGGWLHSRRVKLSDAFAGSASEQLSLQLSLVEPANPRVVGVGAAVVKSAVTDQGETLTALATTSLPEPALTTLGVRSRSLMMTAPAKPARKVTIEGALPVEVAVNQRRQLDAPLSEVTPGRWLPLSGGGWLRVQSLALRPGYAQATFRVTAEAALASDLRRWQFELADEAGRTYRASTYPTGESPGQEVLPGAVMLMSGAGGVPWPGLAWLSSSRSGLRTLTLNAFFATPDASGPGSRLRVTSVERERVELPFTFRDLPLP